VCEWYVKHGGVQCLNNESTYWHSRIEQLMSKAHIGSPFIETCHCQGRPPASVHVGRGLCMPLGIRVYDGGADNTGTAAQQRDRCGEACWNQRTPRAFGPWSSRSRAFGFGVSTSGRCYCQHTEFSTTCKPAYSRSYTAYKFGGELFSPLGVDYLVLYIIV
jgi:hypothetical protein